MKFTSDLHFGHKNIIAYEDRPFGDVDEMTDHFVSMLNDADEPVYILGDFAFGGYERVSGILARITVPLVLIRGNHDSKGSIRAFEEAGHLVYDSDNVKIDDRVFWLSHYPYDEEDERYQDKILADTGFFLLHGHLHSARFTAPRQINVGWDVWRRLVTEDDILQTVEEIDHATRLRG